MDGLKVTLFVSKLTIGVTFNTKNSEFNEVFMNPNLNFEDAAFAYG